MTMRQKIFKNIFLLAITIFLLCLLLITSVTYSFFNARRRDELRAETRWLAAAADRGGDAFLREPPQDPALRLTLIDRDGTVVYDSANDPRSMDNHRDRAEIAQALASGSGESVRMSATAGVRTMNCAERLQDGRVLRVSTPQLTVGTLIVNMFSQMVLALVLALVMSVLVAGRLARAVMRPINEIDLRHPDERDVYDELRPLVQRINLQNRQLQSQMEQLRAEHDQQDQFRREFTANVSHELKTPLTSISGFAEILRDGLVLPEDVSRFAGKIYTEAQHMITLVNDILRLSRLDDQSVEVTREPVDLYALCREVITRLQPLADKRDIRFALDGAPVTVWGTPNVLEEIVYNLCDNAVKYNREHGSVTVTAEPAANGGAHLSVADTGIGIRAEEIPRVFERFYRVDKSHSRELGGTGLGLSIVKHGALLYRAQIHVDSTPGVGTTISLDFPARAEPPSDPA